MKVNVSQIESNLSFIKIIQWSKLIAITGSAQFFIQAIGLVSGILVIRFLSAQEYALYILANTMLGTMTVLADGGISVGVMSRGGQVWQDREKLGIVLATGLEMRRRFAVISLIVSTPILAFLLRHHGATWLTSFLIIMALIPAFYSALSGTLFELVPKLHQDIVSFQKILVIFNISRFLLLIILASTFPLAFVAILASGIAQFWANNRLSKLAYIYANWNQGSDPIVYSEISSMVKRRLPDAIYYCLSSQIVIWIISLIGSTASVAQAGALSRLAVVTTFLNVLFNSLLIPRFARLSSTFNLLFKRYIQIQAGAFVVSVFVVWLVWLFSTEILLILGRGYSDLNTELVLVMIGTCLNFITSISNFLCTSRGWVINPLISIITNVTCVTVCVYILDLSTLKDVFLLNIFTAFTQVVMWMIYTVLNILRLK